MLNRIIFLELTCASSSIHNSLSYLSLKKHRRCFHIVPVFASERIDTRNCKEE